MNAKQVIKQIKALESKKDKVGMARFGIKTDKAFGVSVYKLREIAKPIGKDHELALELWKTGYHEARLLACFIGEPKRVTEKLMENWVKDFDSWDVCDLCCSNLFDATPFAWKKAVEWTKRDEEFVKRAGFVLMAALAVHDKQASDKKFEKFFPIIKKHAKDERNFVRKAVNWALRGIGKRNLALNKKAVKVAKDIKKLDDKTARWIAADALRELSSEKVQKRVKARA